MSKFAVVLFRRLIVSASRVFRGLKITEGFAHAIYHYAHLVSTPGLRRFVDSLKTKFVLLPSAVAHVLGKGSYPQILAAIIEAVVVGVIDDLARAKNHLMHGDSDSRIPNPIRTSMGTPMPSIDALEIGCIYDRNFPLRKWDKSVRLVQRLSNCLTSFQAGHGSSSKGLVLLSHSFIFTVACLLFSLPAAAQGVYIPARTVTGTVNGITRPISGATITVCAANTAGIPCSPALSNAVFKDSGLTVPLSNPFFSDANGNYPQAALASGVYTITETAVGFTGFSYQATVSCSTAGGCSISGPFTVAGAASVTGLLTVGSASVTGAAMLPSITGPTTLTGVLTTSASIATPNISWKTPFDYGAKGDVKTLTDAAITSGLKVLTSTSAPFNCATDVGKAVVISSARTATTALVSRIASCQSSTQVTLVDAAGATVSPATFPTNAYFGTDDTAALNSCVTNGTLAGGTCTLNNNVTFMASNTATTIAITNANVNSGALNGNGTVIFAPYGTLTSGVNDRWLYVSSIRSNGIQIAAGAIAKGATSFTAQNASDVSTWKKGDTVIVHEKDSGLGDFVYSEAMQVSSVSGTTVNVIAPFNTAFPNARAFNNSGTPANCIATSPCGLSAEKINPIIQNVILSDFTLIIPAVTDGTNLSVGIVTTATKNVTIQRISCQNASQNCTSHYLDTGLVYENNHMTSQVQNEFAAQGSPVITGNHFNTETVYGALFNYAIPNGGGVNVDIGTGYATVTGNTFGTSHLSGSPCFDANGGVHNSSFVGNTCGIINAANGITVTGSYNNVFVGNTLAGGIGAAVGIAMADSTGYTVNINSDKNAAISNYVDSSIPTSYNLTGANQTDRATDLVSGNIYGIGTGNFWQPAAVSNIAYEISDSASTKAALLTTGLTQFTIPSTYSWGFSSGASASSGMDTGISRLAAGVVGVSTSPGNASGVLAADGNAVYLTADWTCGTGGTVASCVAAAIIGSGGGVPLTFTLPLVARSWTWDCRGIVGQATGATANSWNWLTATNGATNVTTGYDMATAATAVAFGALTDVAATTTTQVIAPTWTLGATGTKMPFHVFGRIEGASASGTVLSLQLVAPTVADLVTIYRGSGCRIW